VLNFHAGVVASKHKRGSETFYARFREFLQCLRELGYNENYEDASPLSRAYWSFVRCKGDEVTQVDEVAAEA